VIRTVLKVVDEVCPLLLGVGSLVLFVAAMQEAHSGNYPRGTFLLAFSVWCRLISRDGRETAKKGGSPWGYRKE
jgi:hypothetical protein